MIIGATILNSHFANRKVLGITGLMDSIFMGRSARLKYWSALAR